MPRQTDDNDDLKHIFANFTLCMFYVFLQAKMQSWLDLKPHVGAFVIVRLEDSWKHTTEVAEWLKGTVFKGIDLPWRTDVSKEEMDRLTKVDARIWKNKKKGWADPFGRGILRRVNCSIYLNPEGMFGNRLHRELVRVINPQLDVQLEATAGYNLITVRVCTDILEVLVLLSSPMKPDRTYMRSYPHMLSTYPILYGII
jgi:hypothetical protein